MRILIFGIVLCGFAAVLSAEVVDVSPTGFAVRHEAVITSSPANVYRSLTDVGKWWNAEHSHSKNAANLSIDARPGGCFCEKFPGGGGAEHMRVAIAKPGEVLRLIGSLGPLQQSGLAGSMTWTLNAEKSSTKVVLVYSVGGYFRGGFDQIAPAVDGVIGEALARLKRFIETGSPAEAKK